MASRNSLEDLLEGAVGKRRYLLLLSQRSEGHLAQPKASDLIHGISAAARRDS